MNHAKWLIATVCTLLFSACGAVEDVKGMLEQQAQIQAEVKSQIGVDSQVGWNWTNGRLTTVTVTLDGHAVRDKEISELETAIRPIVLNHFDEVPESIVIAAIFGGAE